MGSSEGKVDWLAEFGALKPAEINLVESAARGVPALIVDTDDDFDPSTYCWSDEHEIRGEVLRALALGLVDNWTIDPKGIYLTGADITGLLDLENSCTPHALRLKSCRVNGPVVLRHAKTRTLSLTGCHVNGINADGLNVDGDLELDDGFKSIGEVLLIGADISGTFNCLGGTFTNRFDDALSADGITVKGDVFLRHSFTADGAVRLPGARIGGDLDCDGAILTNTGRVALHADRVTVGGSVFLRRFINECEVSPFTADGEVSLVAANIGSSLSCTGSKFTNPDGNALRVDRATIRGSVFLSDGFTATGQVQFVNSEVGGDLECTGGQFCAEDGTAFDARGVHVKGALAWASIRGIPTPGNLDFSNTEVSQLRDDPPSWNAKGKVLLGGLRYTSITDEAEFALKDRIAWLEAADFAPIAYEQLVRVFRESGRAGNARKVAMAKETALRTRGHLPKRLWFWNWLLEKTVGHGHQLWRPAVALVAFVALGTGVMFVRDARAVIITTQQPPPPIISAADDCRSEYPCFHHLVFTLDVLLPIVDLNQEDNWRPDANAGGWGRGIVAGTWAYTLLGWVITTAVVAGFGALVRRE